MNKLLCGLLGHRWRPTTRPEWNWCAYCPRCGQRRYADSFQQLLRITKR